MNDQQRNRATTREAELRATALEGAALYSSVKSNDITHYQRNLPHRLSPGEVIFLTFRLAGSLPAVALERLRAEYEAGEASEEELYVRQRRYFGRFDAQLDRTMGDINWLRVPTVAELVKDALHFHHAQGSFNLLCYCIMPNHVHVVVGLTDEAPALLRTLKSIKSYTARLGNGLLGRQGQFWQRETYDHVVRDAGELARVVDYVANNPVKAGLAAEWQAWPHTFLAE